MVAATSRCFHPTNPIYSTTTYILLLHGRAATTSQLHLKSTGCEYDKQMKSRAGGRGWYLSGGASRRGTSEPLGNYDQFQSTGKGRITKILWLFRSILALTMFHRFSYLCTKNRGLLSNITLLEPHEKESAENLYRRLFSVAYPSNFTRAINYANEDVIQRYQGLRLQPDLVWFFS